LMKQSGNNHIHHCEFSEISADVPNREKASKDTTYRFESASWSNLYNNCLNSPFQNDEVKGSRKQAVKSRSFTVSKANIPLDGRPIATSAHALDRTEMPLARTCSSAPSACTRNLEAPIVGSDVESSTSRCSMPSRWNPICAHVPAMTLLSACSSRTQRRDRASSRLPPLSPAADIVRKTRRSDNKRQEKCPVERPSVGRTLTGRSFSTPASQRSGRTHEFLQEIGNKVGLPHLEQKKALFQAMPLIFPDIRSH